MGGERVMKLLGEKEGLFGAGSIEPVRILNWEQEEEAIQPRSQK